MTSNMTFTLPPKTTQNAESSDDWPFSSFPSTECVDSVVSVNSSAVNLKIATVPMLQVDIHGIRCNAMCDSGAEVPLISEHLFTQLDTQACGHISMQFVIGQKTVSYTHLTLPTIYSV